MGSQPLDLSIIRELRELSAPGEDLLGEIIDTWKADVPDRLDELRRAVADGDAQSAHRAAHTLKGASSNLGLDALVTACATLDDKARVGELTDAEADLAEIETRYREACELLAAERARPQ